MFPRRTILKKKVLPNYLRKSVSLIYFYRFGITKQLKLSLLLAPQVTSVFLSNRHANCTNISFFPREAHLYEYETYF